MLRAPLALALVLTPAFVTACRDRPPVDPPTEPAPVAPAAPPSVEPPKPSAEPGPATSFRIYTRAERDDAARGLIDELGATQVEVDYVGLAYDVTIPLTSPVPEADQVPYVQALLRAHPAAFGILDATELPFVVEGGFIRVGAGSRWTGQISARFDDRTLGVYGHLWPVAIESYEHEPAALEALVSPYYGLEGEFLSRCLEECHKDSHFTISKQSFSFIAGPALVCAGDHLDVRAAIAIHRRFKQGSRVRGLESLPHLVDAHTLAPIEGAFFMPGTGAATEQGTTFGRGGSGSDHGACFDTE